jgi:hypothetical protein
MTAEQLKICEVCSDCPDLVPYGHCDVCDNRASRAGRARWYIVGKHGEPSGFRERDGTFTPNR